jgi:hypothetical protein
VLRNFFLFCDWFKWFVVGGLKPDIPLLKKEPIQIHPVYANWSKAEYQMHFPNKGSNLGMLGEARTMFRKQPIEYHKKKQEE